MAFAIKALLILGSVTVAALTVERYLATMKGTTIMSELAKLASGIGASLMDAARDSIKKRWTEQAVTEVENLMHTQERLEKERDAINAKILRNANRMAAIEAGLFKVERQGVIVYDDETLNDTPQSLMVEALKANPSAHRGAYSSMPVVSIGTDHSPSGPCWCGQYH